MPNELEPITPADAKEMYLNARKREVSQATVDGYHYRLKHFIRWCEEVVEIDNMNSLSGRDLQRFKTWRRDEGELKRISLKNQLSAVRVFLRWCESIDAVEEGLSEKVEALVPQLDKTDKQSESIFDRDQAEALLEYQRKFEYACRTHVIMDLLWYTGIRLGALHSLDVEDYDADEERIALRHRQDTGTPLKNKEEGERMIALNAEVCRVIEDWIDHHRHDVEDEYGRNPLLTSQNSRMSKSSIRDAVYYATRPCHHTGDCPDGRDIEDCEATNHRLYCKCPLNVSPHDVRRGSITYYLTEDVPEKVVSDRMNVGQDVLDKHYDKRSEEVKVEQRREYLNEI